MYRWSGEDNRHIVDSYFVYKCVETIQEIPKLIKRNGLDFILSNKVIIVIYYVKKETLIERGKT